MSGSLGLISGRGLSPSWWVPSLPSFIEDETSPLLCDPLNEEDYGYSILSKLLVKPAKPAGPAQPVLPAEGCREAAQQVGAM